MPDKVVRFGVFRPEDEGRPDGIAGEAYSAARGRLEGRIAEEPENGQLRLELGSLAAFAGDYAAAESHLREAARLLPDEPRAHLRLADVLHESAMLEEAVEHYRRAAALAEGTPLAEEAVVELELAERELALVYRPLEEAEADEPDTKDSRGLNRLGGLRLAAGRLDDAARAFSRAGEIDPDAVQSFLNYGFVQGLAMVEPAGLKRSVRELSAAIERFPAEPRLYLHLAEMYEASSLYEAAVSRIERAIDADPACLETYEMAARYRTLGGEYGERIAEKIDSLLAESAGPEDAAAEMRLALVKLGKSRFDREDAEAFGEACRILEKRSTGNDEAELHLAECRERRGDIEDAERILQGLVKTSDALRGRAAFALGGLYLRTGRPEEAVTALAAAKAAEPEEAVYYQSLRYALHGARKLRTAELLSRAELEHDPRSVDARLELGQAYLEALRTGDAIEVLEKAAALAPERRDVQLALGKALARADRKEAAEAALRRAVEIDPKSAESRRALGGLLLEMPGRMREGLAELEEYRRLKAEKGE